MLSKKLDNIKRRNNKKKIEEMKIQKQFDFLFTSTLSLLKKDTRSDVFGYKNGIIKYITISNGGYTFHISFIPNIEKKIARVLISEESLNIPLKVKLKFNANKNHCRIIAISHNKLLYIFRIINAEVIVRLIILLFKYL